QASATLRQLHGRDLRPSVLQEVESQVQRRGYLGQLFDAARRRMYALQKGVERKLAFEGNDDLTIQNKARRFQTQRARYDLREISLQILAAFGNHRNFVAI